MEDILDNIKEHKHTNDNIESVEETEVNIQLINLVKELKFVESKDIDKEIDIIIKLLDKQRTDRKRKIKKFLKCCFAVKAVIGIILIIVL